MYISQASKDGLMLADDGSSGRDEIPWGVP